MGQSGENAEDLHPNWQESVFGELHRIAERELARESPGHSLQPTLLVNDAYLRLLDQRNIDPANRSDVLAAGARIIRRLLVDSARKRKAARRGGTAGRGRSLMISVSGRSDSLDILELNEALVALAAENQRVADVVEMQFFGGLTQEEIAERLGLSVRTVRNDWYFAKAWLYDAMRSD